MLGNPILAGLQYVDWERKDFVHFGHHKKHPLLCIALKIIFQKGNIIYFLFNILPQCKTHCLGKYFQKKSPKFMVQYSNNRQKILKKYIL